MQFSDTALTCSVWNWVRGGWHLRMAEEFISREDSPPERWTTRSSQQTFSHLKDSWCYVHIFCSNLSSSRPLKEEISSLQIMCRECGLGQSWPWPRAPVHCPICIVLSTWVGCLHQNQQDRMAMFRSEIISNRFLCSYNPVLGVFVISIWKVIQVNNLMLGCSFCFPVRPTKFQK